MHAVACVKDGDRGRTLRSCALWRALVEFYGEGKGGSNPEGEVVEDEVRGPTVWSVSDLSATRTQGTEVCFTSDLCVSVMLSRSHLFVFALWVSTCVRVRARPWSVRDRDCACRSVRRRDAKLTQNGGVKRKDLTIPPPGSILRAESDRNSLHAVGETDLSHQALA